MADKIVTTPELDTEGDGWTLMGWLVDVGTQVKKDDPLCELESDKVTLIVPSPADGVVSGFLTRVGEALTGGAPLLVLGRPSGAGDGDQGIGDQGIGDRVVEGPVGSAERVVRRAPVPKGWREVVVEGAVVLGAAVDEAQGWCLEVENRGAGFVVVEAGLEVEVEAGGYRLIHGRGREVRLVGAGGEAIVWFRWCGLG